MADCATNKDIVLAQILNEEITAPAGEERSKLFVFENTSRTLIF
jgi:hypothetical protein